MTTPEQQAKELLPCEFCEYQGRNGIHSIECPSRFRAAVAAALGAKDKNRCETCGANINLNGCLVCGAPQCCPQCCQINTLNAEIERLKKPKVGPVQTGKVGAGRIYVPWSILERAYGVYSGKYGKDQSLERLCERGGFGESELDQFVPGWREEMSEIAQLRSQLADRDATIKVLGEAVNGNMEESKLWGRKYAETKEQLAVAQGMRAKVEFRYRDHFEYREGEKLWHCDGCDLDDERHNWTDAQWIAQAERKG